MKHDSTPVQSIRLSRILAAAILGLSVPLFVVAQTSGSGGPDLQNPSGSSSDSGKTDSARAISQAPGTDVTGPPPTERGIEQGQPTVNPITGLVTASAGNYVPLTAEERWKLYFKQTYFSYGSYFGPLWAALVLDQSTGYPDQWGGGFKGYGRRAASRYASGVIKNTFHAPAAAILGEDVRYIASNEHGFKRRLRHAFLYSFLTYDNQGHSTLNISNLGGYYAASAVSTLWLPGTPKSLSLYVLRDGSQQAALSILINLLQEFWPEIDRDVFRRK